MQDRPLTNSENTNGEEAVILAARARLVRINALAFTAQPGPGSRTGWSGIGHAQVRCERDGPDLRFVERGRFTPTDNEQTLAFYNSYRWRLGESTLSLSHERFGRDHPVHLFDLIADGRGKLVSARPHLCGADRYHGRLTLNHTGFTLRWRIHGPAKDELLVYRYFTDADSPTGDTMSVNPDDRIQLIRRPQHVLISAGQQAVADTHAAIELQEHGYPPRLYIPRGDVALDALTMSSKRTHCPFKGDATYFSVQLGDETLADAAWSYETPIDAMAAIGGYLAFDHPELTLAIDGD